MRANDRAASRPSFAFSVFAAIALNLASIMTVTAMTDGWQSPPSGRPAATRVSWITATVPSSSVNISPPKKQPSTPITPREAKTPVVDMVGPPRAAPPPLSLAADEATDDMGAIRFYRSGEVEQRAEPESDWNLDTAVLDVLGIDKLVFDVYYKEVSDTSFKLLRANLTDTFIAIDGQSLADGHYVFKIVARDSPSNPAGTALSGERATAPVDIDNTPPVVTAFGTPQITGDKARVVFDAMDAASYLTRAEYSVNGGEWMPVYADDGISDGPKERYTIEIGVKDAGEYAVTIRVYDVNGNAGNARITVKR